VIKHGVDFAIAADFEWDMATHEPDIRKQYAENRVVSFAPVCGRVFAMVWTVRGETIRVIGLRKANKREVARYEAQT